MFRLKYPDIVKPEYMGCCGIHVRKLASIIAVVRLVLDTFNFIIFIPLHAWGLIGVSLFFFVVHGTVLLADKFEKPRLYVPYIIITGIILCFLILYIILCIPGVILTPMHSKDAVYINGTQLNLETATILPHSSITESDIKAIFIIMLIILIALVVVEYYCLKVVYRARAYMINEVVSGNVQKNCAPIGFKDLPSA